MTEPGALRVLRRTPGRLRVYVPWFGRGGATALARVQAAPGVFGVRPNERTRNVLIEFDQELIDEDAVLELLADGPPAPVKRRSRTPLDAEPAAAEPSGWLRARGVGTISSRPADCIAALLDFERYPDWQSYVTKVTILERDGRGRGILVRTQASVGERELQFTTRYRFPSPNRVIFEQDEGQLEAVRGSWAFRSLGGGRTRATFVLEVRPGWRLGLMLRGSLFDQLRAAVVDHFMHELRERVEGAA